LNFSSKKLLPLSGALVVLLAASGCASMQMGSDSAKTTATGATAGANSQGENSKLEKCDKTLGTMMVVEDTNSDWYRYYDQQYKLGSTAPVLKLLAQQSNCFVVVERSNRAMKSMMRERNLEGSGELREDSNFGKGQMVSADYSLIPTITFSNKDAGGVGGRVSGLLPPAARSLVSVGAGVKAQDASTLLTLIDNRSSVQLAAAEGSARNLDFSAISSVFSSNPFGTGGYGSSSFGGYTKTAEGKVIVAALTDAFNNMVKAVRNYKAQHVEGGLGTGRGGLQVQPK